MGRRIQKSQDVPTFTHKFEPDENGNVDFVELKSSFRLGDRDAINARMIVPVKKFNPVTGEDEFTGDVKMDTSLANVSTLLQAIVTWGGEGFTTNGEIDEINQENVAGLDEDDAKAMVEAINGRNPRAVGPKEKARKEALATNTSAS